MKVVFVGSFASKATDGTVGGQMYACKSLVECPLSGYIEWKLIDSTMRSQPPPNLIVRSFYAILRILNLIKMLAFIKVDALLVFSSFDIASMLEKGIMCFIGRIFRLKVVLSIRSEIKAAPSAYIQSKFKQILLRFPNEIICQSYTALNNLARLMDVPEKKLTVISNWINSSNYCNNRPRVNGNDGNSKFLYLGWVEQQKGIYDLIAAAKILKSKKYTFQIIVCGGGGALLSAKQLVRDANLSEWFDFRGWVTGSDKHDVFSETSIFILPSYSEGVPNALLEAMASGLAVITTPVGGIPDILEDSVNGILVTPGDVVGLSSAMESLLLNPQSVLRMSHSNREKIALSHDVNQAWKKVAKVLNVDGVN